MTSIEVVLDGGDEWEKADGAIDRDMPNYRLYGQLAAGACDP
jgi:hypothetical protein